MEIKEARPCDGPLVFRSGFLVVALAERYSDRDCHSRGCTAGVGDQIGEGVDAALALRGAFRAQFDSVVVHDDDVMGEIAVAEAVVRFVGCHRDERDRGRVARSQERRVHRHVLMIGRPQAGLREDL